LGPFKIIAQVNPVTYRLELLPTMYLYPVFHVSLLEFYKKSQIPSRIPLLPRPIEIDHDMEYEVEEILDSRLRYQCLEYVRFGALEEVFMSYRPHGAWRTMEVLEELA
jgi:hypothetical protein